MALEDREADFEPVEVDESLASSFLGRGPFCFVLSSDFDPAVGPEARSLASMANLGMRA